MNTLNAKSIQKIVKQFREKRKLLIVEKNRKVLDKIIDTILQKIYNGKNIRLYVMELNFENSVKLGDLKKNVKDFIESKSIFQIFPKILLVRNLDLGNKNIVDVYSKVISMDHNILCLSSSTTLETISKSVLINSHIIWNKSKRKQISEPEFYDWLNNMNKSLERDSIIEFVNKKFMTNEDYVYDLELFNTIVESRTTILRDECSKLILRLSIVDKLKEV